MPAEKPPVNKIQMLRPEPGAVLFFVPGFGATGIFGSLPMLALAGLQIFRALQSDPGFQQVHWIFAAVLGGLWILALNRFNQRTVLQATVSPAPSLVVTTKSWLRTRSWEWPAKQLRQIQVRSRRGKQKTWYHLEIVPAEGSVKGFLGSRSLEELDWIRSTLCETLQVATTEKPVP